MDRQNQLWFFFQFLQEVEKELSKEEEKQVMIDVGEEDMALAIKRGGGKKKEQGG